MQTVYFSTSLVLNSRVLLMYTDTVEELPGYPVQNSPSGSFLFWGRAVGRGGLHSIWHCEKGMPQKDPWTTCVHLYAFVFYRRLSPQFQFFNFLCLLLLYSIYLCCFPGPVQWHLADRRVPFRAQKTLKGLFKGISKQNFEFEFINNKVLPALIKVHLDEWKLNRYGSFLGARVFWLLLLFVSPN